MQCNAMQCNAMQCNATQRNATQRNATQRNATQRNATQRNATQRNATQRNATQRNATQRNTTQHNTTQHNTTQHNTTQEGGILWRPAAVRSSVVILKYTTYLFSSDSVRRIRCIWFQFGQDPTINLSTDYVQSQFEYLTCANFILQPQFLSYCTQFDDQYILITRIIVVQQCVLC